MKFDEQNPSSLPSGIDDEGYFVEVYPPGGEQVEVNENKEIITSENKDEDDKDKNEEENYTEEIKLPIYYILEKYKGKMEEWVAKFIETGGYDYI